VPELPERRRPAQAFIEKMVEDYAEAAMRHVWTYQGPDGTWVGEVVGLEGAWSEGETEEKARASLLDIIFDWAMYKIADSDGDIPVLDGIDLNTL
jgi:predicted RNase H-like HicB family nuclease